MTWDMSRRPLFYDKRDAMRDTEIDENWTHSPRRNLWVPDLLFRQVSGSPRLRFQLFRPGHPGFGSGSWRDQLDSFGPSDIGSSRSFCRVIPCLEKLRRMLLIHFQHGTGMM